jgi:toxin ParE1/3/4
VSVGRRRWEDELCGSLTRSAERDSEDIEAYIAVDNPSAGIDTVLCVSDSIRQLGSYPETGCKRRIADTREWIIPETPFIAAYRIRDNTIEGMRVLHGAR